MPDEHTYMGCTLRHFFVDDDQDDGRLRVYGGYPIRDVLAEAISIARKTSRALSFVFNGRTIIVHLHTDVLALLHEYELALDNAVPRAPKMLCETCWDVLTSAILPAACTVSGQEEACCPRCWPLMTMNADGTLSRARWDASREAGEHVRII